MQEKARGDTPAEIAVTDMSRRDELAAHLTAIHRALIGLEPSPTGRLRG